MIQLHQITKNYELGTQGSIQILKGIDLHIQSGEFVAIIGPSGSGKSTLMNIIGMLDIPSSGEYYLSGERVDNLNDSRQSDIRAKKIGFIFQNYSLLPRISALEQVMIPLEYQGFGALESRIRATEYLQKVGLGDKLSNRPNELSGGQSQRVAIARALVINPDIILADEPTGALDSKSGEEILGLFKHINDEGKTVIIITHDPSIAARAQRIIHIKDGEICQVVS
jgi:putative ABC transport system ATP-binding protein